MRPRPPSLLGLVEVVCVLSALGFLFGFLGRICWVFDLCAHFRVQYAATLFLGAAFFATIRHRRSALLSLAGAIAIASTLLPASTSPAKPAGPGRYRIISFNVNSSNTRHRELLDYLLRERPDAIFLMEVDVQWLKDLHELDLAYPYRVKTPRGDHFGLAAYFKKPFTGGSSNFDPADIPVLDVRTQILGQDIRLIGLHTQPPINAQMSNLRNEELLHFADLAATSTIPAILIGDFNLTPYSPWFQEVLQQSKLRSAATLPALSPTWMRIVPIIALPIDQALIPAGLTVIERKIGPSCGSDHSAQVITLGLAEPDIDHRVHTLLPSAFEGDVPTTGW